MNNQNDQQKFVCKSCGSESQEKAGTCCGAERKEAVTNVCVACQTGKGEHNHGDGHEHDKNM